MSKVTTIVYLRTGKSLIFSREGRAISLFELSRECLKEGINVMDREAVPLVKDFTEEEIKN